MTVKFNQYWTVDHNKTSEYGKFIIKEYVPGMNKLGIHIVAGWTVLIGGYSEIFLEGITNDLTLLELALKNENFEKLRGALQKYIINYKTKVLVTTDRCNSYSKDIKEDTIKVIQAWDIKNDKERDYDQFVRYKFYPMLESMSIEVANEWKIFIGDGPNILCEGRVSNITTLIKNLKSKTFQKTRALLKRFVYNYQSRILTMHVCKDLGYKSIYYSVISV